MTETLWTLLMQTATAASPEIAQRGHDLLDEKEAANFLTVEPGTLSVWRSTGRYAIPFIKVGHLVRYRRTDLLAFLESRTRATGVTE